MALCHECGSEVAEKDDFCPFCGISLKPIDLDDGLNDPAFESTIIMPTPKVVPEKHPGKPESEKAPIAAPHPTALEPTLEDISVPSLLQHPNTTDPQVVAGPTDQDVVIPGTKEAAEVEPADKPVHASDVPVPAVLTNLENTTERQFPGIMDRDPDAGVKARASEPPVEVIASDTKAEPQIEYAPPSTSEAGSDPIPEVVRDVSGAAAPSGFEGLPVIEAVQEPKAEDAMALSESQEEQSISKPLDVPIPDDQFSTPSMFDSVRIMESPEPVRSPDAAGPSLHEAGSMASEGETLLKSGPVREPRAATASNIGMVDTDGRKSAKLKPLEEGTLLNNRYEIVRKIGGGGMGAVYLSSDNNLGGVLRAVKEMVQAHIEEAQQEKAILDFKRESMILSTLDHPSIPTIYDYFFDESESRFYLCMKYISGGDLAARLRSAPEGRLDEVTVTEWAIQIADVLDYLHNQPTTIVYRDLKPSNIMIDGNTGRVMLIDFGIARSINQKEEKGVTAVGTMGYAPPELFSGNVEPRSDIYSLGSTMFHLLTGADPQSNPLLIFDFQKNPRPRQINPQLSDQIERFLMKSVEYNAGSRFISAAEVRHVLEEHLENLRKGNVTYGVKEIPASVSLANQSVFCGFCGQKIVATDLFCAFCGAKQPLAQQGVHAEIYTPVLMTAKLFVVGTSDLESPTFSLEKSENLIGRRDPMSNIFPEVDLSKYDPQTKISRRHAKIWRDGTNYVLEDLASSNGTMILPAASDSMRLAPHKPYTLTNGDKIKLGDTTLHFLLG